MTDNDQDRQNAEAEQGAKTFTQAELEAIIGDRLARERAKYADYETLKGKAAKFDEAEEASKTELQKAQDQLKNVTAELDKLKKESAVRQIRDKVAMAKGVPANLLNGATEEECTAQADALLEFAGGKKKYPSVPDGGEVPPAQDGGATKDQFSNWLKENL